METIYNVYGVKERLDFIYTLTCNFECGHCMLECSPSRREKFNPSFAKNIISEGAARGCKSILLSGGEVFCYYSEILDIIDHIFNLGMALELETNGFWGKDMDSVKRYLDPITSKSSNIIIYLSLDYYHSKFLSEDNVLNIAQYCKLKNIPCEVNISPFSAEIDQYYIDLLNRYNIEWVTEDLQNVGRAKKLDNRLKKELHQFHDSDDYAFTIMPDGKCYARCDISTESVDNRITYGFLGECKNIQEFISIYDKFLSEWKY